MRKASDQTGATKLASLRAAIRQNKRSISALTQMASVAETCSSARKATWPFVVRGALVLWVMTSDEDLALAFLREWPQNQRAAAPWTAEHLRQELSSLTEKAKDLLLKPASKLGENALSAATKYLHEKSLFEWTQRQNREKGLAPSYAALWRQFSVEADTRPNSLQRESDTPPASDKHKRQRMRRWSRRWRVVQGRYKAGLRLPLETLREKATVDSEM